MHEAADYLDARFCAGAAADPGLCAIVAYHDDELSHLLFFAGFTVVNVVVMLTQVLFPYRARLATTDTVLIGVNALFIGAGIFANLAFEEIGLDLYVVAAIAALSIGLLLRHPGEPILRYYTAAYLVGLVATAVSKLT